MGSHTTSWPFPVTWQEAKDLPLFLQTQFPAALTLPCDIEEPWSGMQAGMRKRKAVVTDLEVHWCEEQSRNDAQKGGVQVKERKGARHEVGVGGLVSLLCLSQWAFDQPACGVRRHQSVYFPLFFLYWWATWDPPCLSMRWQLWLARWGNGCSVVVGKLSFGWLVGAATCHAFLDPSLVSERGDMRKQEMSFSWNSLPVLKFPPEHCGPDGMSALWLHDSSGRAQGAHLLKRRPVPLLSICGWQQILHRDQNIFCHSILSVLLLSPVSHMKLIGPFCIPLSWLLEKRSQDNLDSMRHSPVTPFIWNGKALM